MNKKILANSILMHSLLFGFGFPLITKLSGSDLIISLLIGTIINIIFLLIFNLIKPLKIISIIISILVIIIYLKIISTYISTFYLINIPHYLIWIIIIILTSYIVSKKEMIINHVCYIMAFINFGLFIVMVIALINKINYQNYLPIITHSFKHIIYGSLIYSLVTIIPYLQKRSNMTLKENLITLFLSTITTITIFALTLGILGPNFIVIYQYPEYMILKEIKMFSFIANVENIFAFIFGNEIIISIILYLKNIKNILITK